MARPKKRTALDALTPLDIERALESVRPVELQQELDPAIQETVTKFGTMQAAQLGIRASLTILDPQVVGFVSKFGAERVHRINDTTKQALRVTLSEGILAGEGSRPLAQRVREVMKGASKARATAIARTEANLAANFARDRMMRVTEIPARRWMATMDTRTRPDHMALNGQVKPMDEPFVINGQTAMYPGGFSDPAQSVNCRCIVVPVTQVADSVRVDRSDREVLAQVDRTFRSQERVLSAAVRRAFIAQERLVLQSLFVLSA